MTEDSGEKRSINQSVNTLKNIITYCRQGFESECALDIADRIKPIGKADIVFAKKDAGYILCKAESSQIAENFIRTVPFASLTFCRQIFLASDEIGPLPKGDRVASCIEIIRSLGGIYSDLFIETADTNEAKQLSGLCKKLMGPFLEETKPQLASYSGNTVPPHEQKKLHVFFVATDKAYVGYSYVNNSSPWHMGIPRLRFPHDAPSRSTLKLDEAFLTFLTPEEQKSCLKQGMTAIDLGASPGGWTWQFVNRKILVTGVDNGNLDGKLVATGLANHVRGDGFTFVPKKPVDWMVCDIVEQPNRIAKLCASWVSRKWCRYSIFNLKLPMKKRYEEVKRCQSIIASELGKNNIPFTVAFKHLYHDREEITGYLRRMK